MKFKVTTRSSAGHSLLHGSLPLTCVPAFKCVQYFCSLFFYIAITLELIVLGKSHELSLPLTAASVALICICVISALPSFPA